MTNYPSVSIIIPTCDRLEMLKRAAASVSAQDYPNITEIIITDDGSGPETERFCLEMAKKDKRVVYLKNTRYKKGPTGNKQNAYDVAKGDFIAGVDDDDALFPDAVSSLMKIGTEKGYEAFFSNCVRSDNGSFTGKNYGKSEEVRYEDLLCGKYEGEYFGINSREIIKKAKFIHELAGMEGIVWLTLYKEMKITAYYLHKAGRLYGVHDGQFSNTYEKNAERSFNSYKTYLEIFSQDLARLCPAKYAYMNQLAAYFAKLSGRTGKAVFHSLAAAKAKKISPFSWFFFLLMLVPLPPKAVVFMKNIFTRARKL